MAGRDLTIDEQDQLIAEAVEREEPRLRSFIRKRVLDLGVRRARLEAGLARALRGAVGADESGGAGAVSRGDARAVGLRVRSGKRTDR
jgi:hypothetical protein